MGFNKGNEPSRGHESGSEPTRQGYTGPVLVLERVEDESRPPANYNIAGKALCFRCETWCWLSEATREIVLSGEIAVLCIECGQQVIPPGSTPVMNLQELDDADETEFLTKLAVKLDHEGCTGLVNGCPECVQVYLDWSGEGATEPYCAVCTQKHWPWEAHQEVQP
jgi:hypothetical protein